MNMIADTNILVRLLMRDDEEQLVKTIKLLDSAEQIVISIQSFCELVWVLYQSYAVSRQDIAFAIEKILEMPKVVADKELVTAGLTMLKAGGDFADAVIAKDGYNLGGELFVSFDKKAVKRLAAQGYAAQLC